MYGLPCQTLADIRADIAFAIRLRPQRLSLFGYAHVPWFRPHQRLIGCLPQGYVQNAPDQYLYASAITAGRPATAGGHALSDEDRTRASLIERLTCDLTVDLEKIAGPHATQLRSEFDARIATILGVDAGRKVQTDGLRITVTEEGRPFLRLIVSAFDAYLDSRRRAPLGRGMSGFAALYTV